MLLRADFKPYAKA
jgi:hypothetical protein